MYTKILILSIFFLSMLSCCSNKNTSNKKEQKTLKTMNLNIYERTSENRIIDSLKIADSPYVYDYQVSIERKIDVNEENLTKLQMLIDDDSNFYSKDVLNQCNPKPDFFLEWENGIVYGFHLESSCPIIYKITYQDADEKIEKKYILNEKKSEFNFVSGLINKINLKKD